MNTPANIFVSDLVRRYDTALRRFLSVRVHPDDIGDLVNECYLRLLMLREPQRVQHPRAFLLTTARNLVRDRWRRRGPEGATSESVVDPNCVAAPEAGPDHWAMQSQLLEMFQTAIAELPPAVATVFMRRRVAGESSQHIAEDLGVTVRTVQKYVAQALAHLNQRLADIVEAEPR